MKVALISFHSFLHPGGVKQHVLGLQKEFRKRGVECKIIAPRRKRQENYGKDVILLGTSFPFNFSGSQSDFCVNFNSLSVEKILKKEKFDILHFHNFGFPSALQILERSRTVNVLTLHADITGSNFLKSFPSILYLFNIFVGWKMDGVIGINRLNLLPLKNFKGPKAVIPNGVDTGFFSPGDSDIKKFSDSKLNILFVGRIEKRKGLIYLLKAFKRIIKKEGSGKLRLIIVGEGPYKEEYEEWVEDNGLQEEVFFEKSKTEKELVSYYRSADIFVSPAIFGESFGIVLVEAMACGVPVVAFANNGYKEVLKGKKAGILAEVKNVSDLTEKISLLIKNDSLRKEMGEEGMKESKKYSWEIIAGQILDFYSLCSQREKKKDKNLFSDENIKKAYSKIVSKLNLKKRF